MNSATVVTEMVAHALRLSGGREAGGAVRAIGPERYGTGRGAAGR